MTAETAAFAERLGPFADRVGAALLRPRCRFPLVIAPNGFPVDDHVGRLARVERMLDRIAGASGNAFARLDACTSLLRLGARIETDLTIEAVLAATSRHTALRHLRAGVERGDWSASRVRERLDADLAVPQLPVVSRMFTGQRIWMTFTYDGIVHGRFKFAATPGAGLANAARRFGRSIGRAFGRRMPLDFSPGSAGEIVAACEFDLAVSRLRAGSYVAFRHDFDAAVDAAALRWCNYPNQNLRHVETIAGADAAARLARVALAVAEFREKRGELPSSLEDAKWVMPGDVPLDPFTETPFVWKKTAAGVRISSAGCLAGEPPPDDATLRERGLSWELKR